MTVDPILDLLLPLDRNDFVSELEQTHVAALRALCRLPGRCLHFSSPLLLVTKLLTQMRYESIQWHTQDGCANLQTSTGDILFLIEKVEQSESFKRKTDFTLDAINSLFIGIEEVALNEVKDLKDLEAKIDRLLDAIAAERIQRPVCIQRSEVCE